MNRPGQLASARIYTGRVLNLDLDRVQFPDGSESELEMIRHSGASAVVPVLDEGIDPRIVLIRQYRYAAEEFLYEIPAGRLAPNETPESCALRELEEEAGYTASALTPLTTIYTTPGFTDERIHLFLARGLRPGKQELERDEFVTVTPKRLSEALAMIRDGTISDAKTAIAILLSAPLLSTAAV